jgi:lipopolysaccharide/colanic/teichoic acid biosynthesis glycosyltransferase
MRRVTTLEFKRAIPARRRARASLAELLLPAAPEGKRRVLNVVVAAIGLLLATPVLVLVAVLIKLTSPGPVFYTQRRVGLDRRRATQSNGSGQRHVDHGGRPFTIYKFRTMRVDGDRGAEMWARPDDPRITSLGRILRKFRLDELPQLFNVLRGDMNVVGPRPEQPAIFASLRARIDGYQRRQRVRPGITGWAQVNLSYDRSIDDVRRKVLLDLQYVARQSMAEDLRIMLRTVPVVLLRKGGW